LAPGLPARRPAALIAGARRLLGVTNGGLVAEREEALAGACPVLLAEELTAKGNSDPPEPPQLRAASPDEMAYLIYTSGSTGAPKAVVVTHRGIATLTTDQREKYGAGPGSRV